MINESAMVRMSMKSEVDFGIQERSHVKVERERGDQRRTSYCNRPYGPFSEKSKQMIHIMLNVKYCKLCEICSYLYLLHVVCVADHLRPCAVLNQCVRMDESTSSSTWLHYSLFLFQVCKLCVTSVEKDHYQLLR